MIKLIEDFEDAVIDYDMANALALAKELVILDIKNKYGDLEVDVQLQQCIAWNRMDAVELLLNVGVNPNGKVIGDTSLNAATLINDDYYASILPESISIDYIKLLLKFGADLELEGSNGWTPLFWAVCRNLEKVTLFLLEQGADPNHKSNLDEDYPYRGSVVS